MTEFRYGPVELYLVGFEGDRPDPGVVQALVDLLEGGLVRLLDFTIISRGEDGEVTVVEIEDETEEYGFGTIELEAVGIAGDEDIAEFAEHIPPGASAALIALELSYARTLAQKLDASGGVVLRTERIPAPIVNAIVDAVEGD
ncbi:DUF6325 family protein [Protaetiibacter mangrovi]|uniref:DUF6325 family protein n=1 Tax=Protaetiibacter mangrovi TaxID=2970926 RepID=A0ABT1ZFX7_9MICO|nr:DUF6325 family protein [Protaetiibacter mangrovi]MCS0499608.1 DUF6325 family protein [Protaetiibacter mangrovi]